MHCNNYSKLFLKTFVLLWTLSFFRPISISYCNCASNSEALSMMYDVNFDEFSLPQINVQCSICVEKLWVGIGTFKVFDQPRTTNTVLLLVWTDSKPISDCWCPFPIFLIFCKIDRTQIRDENGIWEKCGFLKSLYYHHTRCSFAFVCGRVFALLCQGLMGIG